MKQDEGNTFLELNDFEANFPPECQSFKELSFEMKEFESDK